MGQIRRALLGRVLGVYVTASFAGLQILDVLADRLALPDRFFVGAPILLVLGLPLVGAVALIR